MDPSLRPALKRLLSNLTLATVTMEANERKQRAYGACISGSQIRESLEGAVGFFTFSKSKTQEQRGQIWIKQHGRPGEQLNV